MRTAALSITLATLVLLPCWGCATFASSRPPDTVPVKGSIIYKGKPLTKGTVVFEPDDIGREAHGEIQPDGTFVLSTFKEGDGAIRGAHRVSVSNTEKPIPAKFTNGSSSKLLLEVSEATSDYTIELK